ncbi:MAG: hypothetical protein A2Y97_06805 [Nitrospirae bacterium RBG_13_39_12]|nr:MAG: hypothetical protein A2Y97_06805 [Nitrospirae bacterium RBG_13_39_12]
MNKKDIFKLAKESRFIPGIYNYCDYWCERCLFTSRCLTYAIDSDDISDSAIHDLNNETFWNKMQSIFQQTAEIIIELAKEKGIDLNSLDMNFASDNMSLQMTEADNHELSKAASYYAKMADEWFESEYSLFERKEDEINTMLEIGIDGSLLRAKADSINDAVEVIQWYQHQINVKLLRAIMQDDIADTEESDNELQNDADGYTKIALIGMDRSIGAWGNLLEYFPEKTDSILDILLKLDRLRRKTEEHFPKARKFKRPGLDSIG